MAIPGSDADTPPQPEAEESLAFGMTDLEDALRAPGGAELRARIVDRLAVLAEEYKRAMDRGLPPPDYERAAAVRRALAAAREIMLLFPAK